ncbi:unnamed protein product, partial [Didymodactylos carnosus]
MAHYKDGQ